MITSPFSVPENRVVDKLDWCAKATASTNMLIKITQFIPYF
ncbi:hypothetical protein [Cyclobacterium qasimii]|nr:hypothetical protein [Cyclobacterium qasimii]